MTAPLAIKLFGGTVVEKGDEPVTGLVTQKAEVLLTLGHMKVDTFGTLYFGSLS